jgi:hypothetical protein
VWAYISASVSTFLRLIGTIASFVGLTSLATLRLTFRLCANVMIGIGAAFLDLSQQLQHYENASAQQLDTQDKE